MPRTVAVVGTDAVAEAMRQINPDVVAVYPITPQTAIVEKFSEFVADGEVDTGLINVESEHSAMSACIGAAAGGGRVMTCTSSQGLALMWEELYVASGLRLPIVLTNVNRALSAPINIHCDHSDSMGARDSGWIQLYSENAQEAYDNAIQAVRIAENPAVRLPVMVCLDGFIISHAVDRVEIEDDEKVRQFIGDYVPGQPLLTQPMGMGMFDGLYGYYFEAKRAQEEAMQNALGVIQEVSQEYSRLSGRTYGLWEEYQLEDAEECIVALNSAAGTIKSVIDRLRAQGRKIGLLKPRVFRPWPGQQLAQALSRFPVIAVFDRSMMFNGGYGGHLYNEIRSAFYDSPTRPLMVDYIYGLGGRDLSVHLVEQALAEVGAIAEKRRVEQPIKYLGLRE